MAKRRPNKYQRAAAQPPRDLSHLANGGARVEWRRGEEWFVRDVSAARAVKSYVCPDCGNTVPPGQAHIVAWRRESVLGDARALADRRHYHAYCWRLP